MTRNAQREAAPFAERALKLHLSTVAQRSVLDDGKPKPRAAGLLRTALVGAVETFEHLGLVLLGDPDAGICHAHESAAIIRGQHRHIHRAAGFVVPQGVLHEIRHRVLQQRLASLDRQRLSCGRERDARLLRQCAHRRQLLPRGQLPGGDGQHHLIADLLVDGHTAGKIQTQKHRTVTSLCIMYYNTNNAKCQREFRPSAAILREGGLPGAWGGIKAV